MQTIKSVECMNSAEAAARTTLKWTPMMPWQMLKVLNPLNNA